MSRQSMYFALVEFRRVYFSTMRPRESYSGLVAQYLPSFATTATTTAGVIYRGTDSYIATARLQFDIKTRGCEEHSVLEEIREAHEEDYQSLVRYSISATFTRIGMCSLQ